MLFNSHEFEYFPVVLTSWSKSYNKCSKIKVVLWLYIESIGISLPSELEKNTQSTVVE